MSNISAKDVQALRQATGAGMMDAKAALTENDGDFEAATKWLREKGLAKAASRTDRENDQGAVALVESDGKYGLVELKSETDFSAKAADFVQVADDLATAVAERGVEAVAELADAVDQLKLSKKENIEVGKAVQWTTSDDTIVDSYLHRQEGRGVNAVLVEVKGGTVELAHDIAVHIAFTKPLYQSREEVPAEVVATERETLVSITKAEGKPEAAIDKIVEGRLNGWFKERVLLEQGFVKDEKHTVAQMLEQGGASLVRFEQAVING